MNKVRHILCRHTLDAEIREAVREARARRVREMQDAARESFLSLR